MKITPSSSRTSPLYPTLMAMVGTMLTGCDKQTTPGIEPFDAQKETQGSSDEQSLAGFPASHLKSKTPDLEKLLQQTPEVEISIPDAPDGAGLKLGGEALTATDEISFQPDEE